MIEEGETEVRRKGEKYRGREKGRKLVRKR
jgi:hypothetical protein